MEQFLTLMPGLACGVVALLMGRLFDACRRIENSSTRKEVLIVRLDVIGDFILWLDAAKELRRIFPKEEYTLTLLGNSIWTDLARSLPYFDEVLPLDRSTLVRSPASFIKLVWKLHSVRFDTVLHPVFSREFLFGDFFVWASDAKEKIGMQGEILNQFPWLKRLSDRFYTRLLSVPTECTTELERNAEFLRGLGLTNFCSGVPMLEMCCETSLSLPSQEYFVIFPGASVAARRWPAANFVTLVEKIHAATGLNVVVCGGPAEEQLGQYIEKRALAPVLNLVGMTSLRDLVAVIAGGRFLVGNETGAVHIAAAVGVPSICILGGGHFGRFMPYSPGTATLRPLPTPVLNKLECFGCNWKCIYATPPEEAVPCISKTSVDQVFAAVLELRNL